MLVVLDDRTLEPSLPDVSAGTVVSMVALRVRNEQALHDAADRRFARPQHQMKMVAHQAVAVQLKRLACLQVGQRGEERLKIGRLAENQLAVVAQIDDVVNQAVGDRSQGRGIAVNLATDASGVKEIVLTPFCEGTRRWDCSTGKRD